MAIDGIGWDWSYMANKEDHAIVADGETPTEFALMANTKNKVFDNSLCSKYCKKNTDSLNSKINELKSELSESNTYRHSDKRPKGNQMNWNNLKSYQLGLEFVLHKKSCFNCGDFSHLANDCMRRVQRETNRYDPSVNRKFSTGRRNFPTANRKFPTASRKFATGNTKYHTADMGRKGKALKPLACSTWNPSQVSSNK
nr:hypothetical protein [Tanacetum cinerariifolium]